MRNRALSSAAERPAHPAGAFHGPWYREPWPWFLMAGPLAVILAGVFTLWLAVRSEDGLVADDYYKRGLAINQTLARAQRAEQLGLAAVLTAEAQTPRVRVALTGRGALPAELNLRFVHPTRAVADQLVVLRATAPGTYEGDRVASVAGRRVVMLEDMARTWRLAGEAAGAGSGAVVLAPQ